MKKLIVALIVLALFVLAACSRNEDAQEGTYDRTLENAQEGTHEYAQEDTHGHTQGSAQENQNYFAPGNAIPMVSAGGPHFGHTAALRSDGTVWTWGSNQFGQLGLGHSYNRDGAPHSPAPFNTPVQAQSIYDVIAVVAGNFSTIALRSNGTVWSWGGNNGEFGDGRTSGSYTPVQARSLDGVTAIAANTGGSGNARVMALRNDGTVWEWGGHHPEPIQVQGLDSITAITSNDRHPIALRNDGTVWVLGLHFNNNEPMQLPELENVVAVSGGIGQTSAIVVKNDGTVWTSQFDTWRDNHELTQVQELDNITYISSSGHHVAALRSDGTVWAWGNNSRGQLGDGTSMRRDSPVQVEGLYNVVAVSAGAGYTMAVRSDGTVWGWGSNNTGLLGDGSDDWHTLRYTPVQVLGYGGEGLLNLGAASAP